MARLTRYKNDDGTITIGKPKEKKTISNLISKVASKSKEKKAAKKAE